MTEASDVRFWDLAARKYAKSKLADQGGYERTLERTRALLKPGDRVLELGCGTGTTALRLAGAVQSYLATDISPEMIAIADEKHAAGTIPGLTFRADTADSLSGHETPFNAVLAFNYLHLVRDLPDTLRRIHSVLAPDGLFISKTPCVGDMNLMIRRVLLPAMRAVGKAPHVLVFRKAALSEQFRAAGFDILASESHATKDRDIRSYIVARRQ
ncbi:MAG: class I SAM-dependent methyltransferase [Rhodobacteraceae bacterium]|nr:class I SAM-dependent methyltransferase [Paracoccaceae bacterium]